MENTLTSQQSLRPEDELQSLRPEDELQYIRPEDELQYIRKIIDDSRAAFVEDGKPYIMWGLIVAIGMGFTYFSALTQRDIGVGWAWLVLVLFGWGSIIYYMFQKKKQPARARSFVDRIQGSIWGACGGTLGLALILILNFPHSGNAPQLDSIYTCFVASLILGIAYFLSGIANDLNWLRNVGFAWWAGAIVMYLWPTVHVLGIYAGMLLLFQVVPGIILQRRYKRITSQPSEA
jgi:hypothetical protein